MINSPNIVQGMYGDPTAFYGTSAQRLTSIHKESENKIATDAPIDGPVKFDNSMVPEGSRNITVGKVLNSPTGLTVVLLPLAYIAFHYAFGA